MCYSAQWPHLGQGILCSSELHPLVNWNQFPLAYYWLFCRMYFWRKFVTETVFSHLFYQFLANFCRRQNLLATFRFWFWRFQTKFYRSLPIFHLLILVDALISTHIYELGNLIVYKSSIQSLSLLRPALSSIEASQVFVIQVTSENLGSVLFAFIFPYF